VLALDPGAKKPCGGCISLRWSWLFDWFGKPGWFYDYPINRLCLNWQGKIPVFWQTQKPGAVLVQRNRLDDYLSQKIKQKNVKIIKAGLDFLETRKGKHLIRTSRGDFSCSWVVAASGSSLALKKRLELGAKSSFTYKALVYETKVNQRIKELLTPGAALIDLGAIPFGYGWIFQRGDIVNLGLATRRADKLPHGQSLPTRLADFAKNYGLDMPEKFRGAIIPCPDRRLTRLTKGNILLTGDSACLADPFLGEGIGQAMLSGRLAAEAIIKGTAEYYVNSLKKGLIKEHAHARILAGLIYNLPGWTHVLAKRHPGSLEIGFKLLRGEITHKTFWTHILGRLLGFKPSLDRQPGGYYSKRLN
jgi:flavin-dependent dehydrogenase